MSEMSVALLYFVLSLFLRCSGGNSVLIQRHSCVEAYAEDAQAPASSFGSEKEGNLSKE